MTRSERAAVGKAARSRAKRSSHGDWEPAPGRADPIAVLELQGRDRVPELLPIRHGRMAASPFAFFRGAAAVMAADLAPTPVTDLTVQACGDAHLANFGIFAAPDRRLVFDLNDFDETLPGPWEWDVKRLVASFAVAGRENEFGAAARRGIESVLARSYREAMRDFAGRSNLEVWYARIDVESRLAELEADRRGEFSRAAFRRANRTLAKARGKDRMRALERLTRRRDGELRLASEPPLLVPIEEMLGDDAAGFEAGLREIVTAYRASLPADRRALFDGYEIRDLAHKVVGVGSVGTRAWVVLLTGIDDGDPLFIQAKEAGESVLEPYAGSGEFEDHGRRVVEGQRLLQAASDIFLGWAPAIGFDGRQRNYYLRQLWDGKASADLERMEPATMRAYAELCGWTLARAHARSGDRVAIAAYLGNGDSFDRALVEFAERYADVNEADHAALLAAIAAGRVEAVDA